MAYSGLDEGAGTSIPFMPDTVSIRRRRRRPGFQDRTILSDDLTVIYKPHTATPSVDVTESTIESTRDFTMIPPIQTIDATTSSPSSNSSDEKVPLSIEAYLQLKSTHHNAKTYGKRKRGAVVDLNHGPNGFNSDDAAMGSGSGEDESQEMSGVTSDTLPILPLKKRKRPNRRTKPLAQRMFEAAVLSGVELPLSNDAHTPTRRPLTFHTIRGPSDFGAIRTKRTRLAHISSSPSTNSTDRQSPKSGDVFGELTSNTATAIPQDTSKSLKVVDASGKSGSASNVFPHSRNGYKPLSFISFSKYEEMIAHDVGKIRTIRTHTSSSPSTHPTDIQSTKSDDYTVTAVPQETSKSSKTSSRTNASGKSGSANNVFSRTRNGYKPLTFIPLSEHEEMIAQRRGSSRTKGSNLGLRKMLLPEQGPQLVHPSSKLSCGPCIDGHRPSAHMTTDPNDFSTESRPHTDPPSNDDEFSVASCRPSASSVNTSVSDAPLPAVNSHAPAPPNLPSASSSNASPLTRRARIRPATQPEKTPAGPPSSTQSSFLPTFHNLLQSLTASQCPPSTSS